MPGTVVVSLAIQADYAPWTFPLAPPDFTIATTNPGSTDSLLALTTTEEAVPTADLVSPGLVVLWNIGATGSIEYGPESAGAMVALGQIPPGEYRVVDLKAGVTLKVKAVSGTATCWAVVFDR